MIRTLSTAVVLAMLAAPAMAGGDDLLKRIFDRDGPGITHGISTDTGTTDKSAPANVAPTIGAPLAIEAEPASDCGTLFVYGSCSEDDWNDDNPPAAYVDPETGETMYRDDRTGVYFPDGTSQEEKDGFLDSDGDSIIDMYDDGKVLCDEGYCDE